MGVFSVQDLRVVEWSLSMLFGRMVMLVILLLVLLCWVLGLLLDTVP